MKKFCSFALGFGLLGLASCASDEPLDNGGSDLNTGVKDTYATITINLPSAGGTRATNDDGTYAPDGIEVGQDYENNVGKIVVALATKKSDAEYNLLTYAISDSKEVVGSNKLQYVLNFSSKELIPDYVEADKTTGDNTLGTDKVYVFAYCNPSSAFLTHIDENWTAGFNLASSTATITSGNAYDPENPNATEAMWTPNKFLMTNHEIAEVITPYDEYDNKIPPRNILVSQHNTAGTALNLGTVDVARAAARFDFMPVNMDGLGVNKYAVKDIDGQTEMGVIELTDMAIFNISRRFYYLPRTNSNWLWTGTTTLCSGKDNTSNFVVSTDATLKKTQNLTTSALASAFFYPINTIAGYDWTSIRVEDWNKWTNDIDEGWSPSEGTTYKIWRYTTENTIPQWGDTDNANGSQRVGITTGVAFKAKFTPSNKSLWNGNVIYMYKNVVYGDYKALLEYVTTSPDTEVAQSFKQVTFFNVSADKIDDVLKTNLLSTASTDQKHGFTAYNAPTNEDGTYDMYYFYYNRHATNGINTTLGVNEFGVVRNNVYKLKVNSVNSLGLPTPPDPNTEDEEEQAYFSVSVRVLPWIVRINDIDF